MLKTFSTTTKKKKMLLPANSNEVASNPRFSVDSLAMISSLRRS